MSDEQPHRPPPRPGGAAGAQPARAPPSPGRGIGGPGAQPMKAAPMPGGRPAGPAPVPGGPGRPPRGMRGGPPPRGMPMRGLPMRGMPPVGGRILVVRGGRAPGPPGRAAPVPGHPGRAAPVPGQAHVPAASMPARAAPIPKPAHLAPTPAPDPAAIPAAASASTPVPSTVGPDSDLSVATAGEHATVGLAEQASGVSAAAASENAASEVAATQAADSVADDSQKLEEIDLGGGVTAAADPSDGGADAGASRALGVSEGGVSAAIVAGAAGEPVKTGSDVSEGTPKKDVEPADLESGATSEKGAVVAVEKAEEVWTDILAEGTAELVVPSRSELDPHAAAAAEEDGKKSKEKAKSKGKEKPPPTKLTLVCKKLKDKEKKKDKDISKTGKVDLRDSIDDVIRVFVKMMKLPDPSERFALVFEKSVLGPRSELIGNLGLKEKSVVFLELHAQDVPETVGAVLQSTVVGEDKEITGAEGSKPAATATVDAVAMSEENAEQALPLRPAPTPEGGGPLSKQPPKPGGPVPEKGGPGGEVAGGMPMKAPPKPGGPDAVDSTVSEETEKASTEPEVGGPVPAGPKPKPGGPKPKPGGPKPDLPRKPTVIRSEPLKVLVVVPDTDAKTVFSVTAATKVKVLLAMAFEELKVEDPMFLAFWFPSEEKWLPGHSTLLEAGVCAEKNELILKKVDGVEDALKGVDLSALATSENRMPLPELDRAAIAPKDKRRPTVQEREAPAGLAGLDINDLALRSVHVERESDADAAVSDAVAADAEDKADAVAAVVEKTEKSAGKAKKEKPVKPVKEKPPPKEKPKKEKKKSAKELKKEEEARKRAEEEKRKEELDRMGKAEVEKLKERLRQKQAQKEKEERNLLAHRTEGEGGAAVEVDAPSETLGAGDVSEKMEADSGNVVAASADDLPASVNGASAEETEQREQTDVEAVAGEAAGVGEEKTTDEKPAAANDVVAEDGDAAPRRESADGEGKDGAAAVETPAEGSELSPEEVKAKAEAERKAKELEKRRRTLVKAGLPPELADIPEKGEEVAEKLPFMMLVVQYQPPTASEATEKWIRFDRVLTVREAKERTMEEFGVSSELSNDHQLFIPYESGVAGLWLEEEKQLASYGLDDRDRFSLVSKEQKDAMLAKQAARSEALEEKAAEEIELQITHEPASGPSETKSVRVKQNKLIHDLKVLSCEAFGLPTDDWLSAWRTNFPGNDKELIAKMGEKKARIARCLWDVDGLRLLSVAALFRSHHSVVAACVGDEAAVLDLGEPLLYLDGIRRCAFEARDAFCYPTRACAVSVRPQDMDAIRCSNWNNVLVHRSIIEGQIVINTSCLSRVVISNSVIHVPSGSVLVIGEEGDDVRTADDGVNPRCYVLESCLIDRGGWLRGSNGLLVGFDSSCEPRGELLVSPGNEMIVTLSLKMDSSKTKRVTSRWTLQRSVKAVDPSTGCSALESRCILGLNFEECLRRVDAADLLARDGNLKAHTDALNTCGRHFVLSGDGYAVLTSLREPDVSGRLVSSSFRRGFLSLFELFPHVRRDLRELGLYRRFQPLGGGEQFLSGGGSVRHFREISARRVSARFCEVFFKPPDVVVAAPGRLNCGGAHTDWSYMKVCGFAIDQDVLVGVRRDVSAESEGTPVFRIKTDANWVVESFVEVRQNIDSKSGRFSPFCSRANIWANYVLGCLEHFRRKGLRLCSMDILICSNLEHGQGLSSSAALENAVMLALHALLVDSRAESEPVDLSTRMQLAVAANEIENSFVGVGCGILDQGVSALGRRDHFLLLDCAKFSPSFVGMFKVPLRKLGYDPVVVDTGTRRSLAMRAVGNESEVSPDSCDWFRRSLSEFNLRVFRYWSGVNCLYAALPLKPSDDGGNFRCFSLASSSNPRLLALVRECEGARPSVPGRIAFIVPSMSEMCVPSKRAELDVDVLRRHILEALDVDDAFFVSESSFLALSAKRRRALVVLAVYLEDELEPDAASVFVGLLEAKNVDFAIRVGLLTRDCVIETAKLVNIVEYMVRENFRIEVFSQLFRVEQSNETNNSPPGDAMAPLGDDQCVLGEWIRSHADAKIAKGLAVRGAFEHYVSDKLETETSFKSLSDFERMVVFGLLGDIAWTDKRDLFDGDTPWGTLQKAFDLVDVLEQGYADVNQFVVLGKFAPGAGWGGSIGIFMLSNQRFLDDLRYLIGPDRNSYLDLERQMRFAGATCFADLPKHGGESERGTVRVWSTCPSDGMEIFAGI